MPAWRKMPDAREKILELISDLKDEDESGRWVAAWTLGEIGDPKVIRPLV